ncbi:MAG: WD40 repeat domain-containing protein [Bauldia sp.]
MTSTTDFGAFVVDVAVIAGVPAFALGDGTVRLGRGGTFDTLSVHKGAILRAVATLDEAALLTGGDDGLLARVSADGDVKVVADHPKKWVTEIAAGPSGVLAYAIGRDVIVRAGPGRERVFSLQKSAGGLAFAPKGQRVAIARYNGVTLYFAATDAPGLELNWKGAHIGVTFSPDGRYLVTAMQENALHGWRLEDGLNLRMTGYPAKPRSFSWSPKGRFLATSGSDAAVLWPFHFKDGPQGKSPHQVGRRASFVTRVACHPRKDAIAIGYQDGAVAVAPTEGKSASVIESPGGSPVSALAWDILTDTIVFGTESGRAGILSAPI